MQRIEIFEAKQRLRIPDLWRHFGYPGRPKTSCPCPWRQDHKPSFSVSQDGLLWNDFGAGEGGDAIDFLQWASGLSKKDAFRKFLELAGGSPASSPSSIPSEPQLAKKPLPEFPILRMGTLAEVQQLAIRRNIGLEGLHYATERGVLRFGDLKGSLAWVVTDRCGVNAQARRLDGQLWAHIEAKAWTLPGSWASYPIGIQEARIFPSIALCEGGPDFLAAHYMVLWEQASHYRLRDVRCAPIAMLGASLRIHPDALPFFASKRIRIFAHTDREGREAAERWTDQRKAVAGEVDSFNFDGLLQIDGRPVEDLNDALNMDKNSYIAKGEMLFP